MNFFLAEASANFFLPPEGLLKSFSYLRGLLKFIFFPRRLLEFLSRGGFEYVFLNIIPNQKSVLRVFVSQGKISLIFCPQRGEGRMAFETFSRRKAFAFFFSVPPDP